MADRVKFRSWLYVRIDKPLRAALIDAAQAQGVTVSDLARRELRKSLAGSFGLPLHHIQGDRP